MSKALISIITVCTQSILRLEAFTDLIYREPDNICSFNKVNHHTKPTESVADTLNADYETVATGAVKSPNIPHAIHAVPRSTLYAQIH